eukprot:4570547-Amphidinium_carterae.1
MVYGTLAANSSVTPDTPKPAAGLSSSLATPTPNWPLLSCVTQSGSAWLASSGLLLHGAETRSSATSERDLSNICESTSSPTCRQRETPLQPSGLNKGRSVLPGDGYICSGFNLMTCK